MNNADDISQSERRKVMESDRLARKASTYHQLAEASANDLAGGRFAQSSPKQRVIGSSPISYPELPENSPWAKDPMPPEPPLGWSVNDLEPTGEVWEIEKSQGEASSMKAADDAAGDRSIPVSARGGPVTQKFRRRI
jgi:hypothetical protein